MNPRVVGQIVIQLLEDGSLALDSKCPGGRVMALGMIEAAKMDLAKAVEKRKEGPHIEIAKNGLAGL